MGIYFTGVVIAAIIGLVKLIITMSIIFSNKAHNLKKVGLYFNPSAGDFTKSKPTWKGSVFLVTDMVLITPLLSWLSVVWSVILYIKGFANKAPVPDKIKEIQFKLSSIELPKDKVKEYMDDIAKFYGLHDAGLDSRSLYEAEDDPDLLIIEPADGPDDWYRDIQLNRPNKTITMNSRTPDYLGRYTTVFEYKLDGTHVWIRTIESKSQYAGYPDEYDITDNVIMELDVTNRYEDNSLKVDKLEDKLDKLRNDVEWSEYKINKISYFVLFRHYDLFSDIELRKYFRSELERISMGYKKYVDKISKFGGYIVDDDPYCKIHFKENVTEEEKVNMKKLLDDESESELGISFYEFSEYDFIKPDLEKYINKL